VEPLRSPRSVSIEEPANRLRTYAVAINGSSKTGENFQSEYPALACSGKGRWMAPLPEKYV